VQPQCSRAAKARAARTCVRWWCSCSSVVAPPAAAAVEGPPCVCAAQQLKSGRQRQRGHTQRTGRRGIAHRRRPAIFPARTRHQHARAACSHSPSPRGRAPRGCRPRPASRAMRGHRRGGHSAPVLSAPSQPVLEQGVGQAVTHTCILSRVQPPKLLFLLPGTDC